MSQRRRKQRRFEADFKLKVVKRLLKGENVAAVSREIGVLRKDLYQWKRAYQRGGEGLLRPPGRPSRQSATMVQAAMGKETELERARKRIEALERKVGQQELELDFFGQALRCIETEAERVSERSAVSSSRKRRKAN